MSLKVTNRTVTLFYVLPTTDEGTFDDTNAGSRC